MIFLAPASTINLESHGPAAEVVVSVAEAGADVVVLLDVVDVVMVMVSVVLVVVVLQLAGQAARPVSIVRSGWFKQLQVTGQIGAKGFHVASMTSPNQFPVHGSPSRSLKTDSATGMKPQPSSMNILVQFPPWEEQAESKTSS
eukprot:CAMPEP_0206543452 /NCGR_PEP_ID=MMETSP0325_2-20121206/10875_1 /ASSEMBLY_ACC=CAM_ASM_000347 /TAXON_ID=2866 /ORGANISM="Crypthecodinium cohnii, Strain Seligo" /LENGTH=142 /DNA_ID=CAMNT_0054041901 /DNA_START=447 /DNA_END=876 /DNA_ORIENTATION=-